MCDFVEMDRRVSARYPERSYSSKKAGAFKAKQRRLTGITALRAMMGRSAAPAALYPPRYTGSTELKSCDSGGSGSSTVYVNFVTGGTVQQVLGPEASDVGILSGTGFYNRIGARIRTKSIEIRGTITPSLGNAAAVADQFARIMVLYDRQPNGALPSTADILLDYQSAGATTTTARSGLNMNNRDRFLVLRDRKMYLPPLGVNGATPAKIQNINVNPNQGNGDLTYHEYIRCKDLETHYKASSGVIGDVATGAFVVLVISDGDTNATSAYQFAYVARQKFLD